MNNILQTTKAEWDAFFEEMAPRWLRWLKDNGTSVDSIEVYSPADYAEFAKRVRSLPARYDWEGVRKTVLVPVEILSRDAYNAKQEADKAAEEAREASRKADQAADSANKAAARAETAFDDLDQIKGETLAAAGAANLAANRANAAVSEAVDKMTKFSSAEAARATAEQLRKDAEAARVKAEELRAEAESKRETAEKLRAEAEKKRQAAHDLLEAFLANPPKIENGTWRTYNPLEEAYEDTGVKAMGRSPYIDEETGHWFVYDDVSGEYQDTGIKTGESGDFVRKITVDEVIDGMWNKMLFNPEIQESTDTTHDQNGAYRVVIVRNYPVVSDDEDEENSSKGAPEGVYLYDGLYLFKKWPGSEKYKPESGEFYPGALYITKDGGVFITNDTGFVKVNEQYFDIFNSEEPGLVPAPGENTGFLNNYGHWVKPNWTDIQGKPGAASQSANGLMSAEDKKKLDNLIKIQVLDLLIDDECTDQPLPAGFKLPETDNTGSVVFGRIRDAGSCLVPCVSLSNYQSRWHFFFRTSNLSVSVSINTATSTYSVQIQNLLPSFTTSQRTDGITYGFKNGQLEKVADAGKDVLNADAVTATSLAIGAYYTGELSIDSSTPPEMIEEVRELLGDELFNEFSAKAVQTMELAPVLSDKERLEQAKAAYYERKAEMERLVKEMQQQALLEETSLEQSLLDEGKSNLDVEPSKSESI